MAPQLKYHRTSLYGEVEVDGAYFGGHIRPANYAENRIDRRKAEHQTGTRRVVIAARKRKGRTLTAVVRSEAEGVAFVEAATAKTASIHADEASHWTASTTPARCPASTIRKPIATTVPAPIRPKATSAVSAGWCQASTTTLPRVASTTMPRKLLGWRITAGQTMAGWYIGHLWFR